MNYLNQRQRVISQNVANADTVNYRPQDLKEVDFGRVLQKVTESHNIRLDTTNKGHLPPPNEVEDPKEAKQKKTYEVAPDGNAVIMEEQLLKAGKTSMDYNLMASLLQKNLGMIRTAIGRGQ